MQPVAQERPVSDLLGAVLMAKINTFFCDCDKTLNRPTNTIPKLDAKPIYNVVPWHARPGDGVIRGLRCGKCGQWWDFIEPKQWPDYADVRKSCAPGCSAHDHFNGRC